MKPCSSFAASCLFAAACCLPAASQAAVVTGQYSLISGTTWSLSLTVINNGTPAAIPGFSVFFDETLFSNLALPVAPLGWDPLVLQPNLGLSAEGLFDVYVNDPLNALTPGQSLAGFSVRFDYLGVGAPGALRFETYVLDASGLPTVLESGTVRSVPVPGSLWLAALGLCALPMAPRRHTPGPKELA